MPGEMDGKSGAFAPRRFGRGEECEAVVKAALHFHHMRDDVNGAGMPRIERQRLLRNSFGAPILSILLEGKSVHRKDARVTRHLSRPVRQHLRHPVAHHASPAKVEVERMRDRKRQHVVRPVDEEGIVERDRMAGSPSSQARAATAWRRAGSSLSGHAASIAAMLAASVDRGAALSARTMSAARRQWPKTHPGSSAEHPLDLGKGVATLRQQHVERAFAALQRVRFGHGNRGRCCVMRPVLRQVFARPRPLS